ncbi:MAG: HAMP domain-containing protein [Acidobacteria bacterium]|nr:HAMP domain-containing protein [Acidobacteriota bacterium]MBI3423156.1 HAMP domain-containing protein [Acidobacteriota bacterium]
MLTGTLSRLLSSFRAQLVAFITAMLLLTALVIFFINQQLERRTTRQVDEYFQSIILAMDLSYRSLAEGKYLYELVNTRQPNSLPIDSESVIKHILILDASTKEISDSTDKKDIGTKSEYTGIPTFAPGDVKLDADSLSANESRSVKFSIETDKGKIRDILIVISLKRLKRVKDAADRDRSIALTVLGLLLIVALALFSQRFTRPVTELARAAQRVTAGKLDFDVTVSGPQEISTLSSTFNEMLTGLRRNRDLEEQLQRAERSAVVGRLASGIAHEIRNPLNFMNLSIDHLQAACAPTDERRRAEFLHITTTIKEEIQRLNRLVSDFLSYGRPARLKPRELDAQVLIEEVGALVRATAEQQGVQVRIASDNGPNNVDTKFQADYEQIKTCFSNLMINAVQAMPGGGALNVTLHPDNSHLQIEFADNGPGIAAENLKQIFEPYYSTKETGIGLGLPLTKKIIEEHGGQITVTSELGTGTTFNVTLPREAAC